MARGTVAGRLPIATRAPEAVRLTEEEGLPQWRVAQELGVSERYVRDILKHARNNGLMTQTRETKTAREKLTATLEALHAHRDRIDVAITATESALAQLP